MLVCRDESIAFSPEDRGTIGVRVRVRGGEIELDTGPRVATTAPASGFNILECADLDEPIEVSAKHPIARYGFIELRPIAEADSQLRHPRLACRGC